MSFPILIVEDDLICRFGVKLLLSRAGYDADEAGTGIEAIAKFGEKDYSLVLMDFDLPDMTGLACASQLRKSEKCANSGIPVVFWTSRQSEKVRRSCLQLESCSFMSKQAGDRCLLEALAKIIQ